jgi:hypothetical protein
MFAATITTKDYKQLREKWLDILSQAKTWLFTFGTTLNTGDYWHFFGLYFHFPLETREFLQPIQISTSSASINDPASIHPRALRAKEYSALRMWDSHLGFRVVGAMVNSLRAKKPSRLCCMSIRQIKGHFSSPRS